MATISAELVGASYRPGGATSGQKGEVSTSSFGSPRHVLTQSQEIHLDAMRAPQAGADGSVVKTFAVRRSAQGAVGLRFYRDGTEQSGPLVVSEVLPGSPAAQSGLVTAGHTIQEINARSVDGLSVPVVEKLLQGAPGSNVLIKTGLPPASSQRGRCPSVAAEMRPPVSGARTTSGASIYDEWYQKSPRSSISNNQTPVPASSPGHNPQTDPLGAHDWRQYRTVPITRDEAGGVGMSFRRQAHNPTVGPVEIVAVEPGGAASRTEVAPGDLMYRIGRWDLTELPLENVTGLLRGTPGSVIEVEVVKQEGLSKDRSMAKTLQDPSALASEVADVKITLHINSNTAGTAGSRQRVAFEEFLAHDLSRASDHPETSFEIQSIEAGCSTDGASDCTVVMVRISRDGSRPPNSVAAGLAGQLSQPYSDLMLGDISCHCTAIEVVYLGAVTEVPGVSVGCGKIMSAWESITSPRESINTKPALSPPPSQGFPKTTETHVLESIGAGAFHTIDNAYHSVEKIFSPSPVKDSNSDMVDGNSMADFALELDVPFERVGTDGSFERSEFKGVLCRDLACASGWQAGAEARQSSSSGFRNLTVERTAAGLGLHFSVAKRPKGTPAPAKVKALASGSAAAIAGLREGDLIHFIDGEDITSFLPAKMAELLRGAPGTKVVLTVTSLAAGATTSSITALGSSTGLSPQCFHIKALSPGSVRVDMRVEGSKLANAVRVVEDLERQAKDRNSQLRQGSVTRHLKSLTPGTSLQTVTLNRSHEGTVGLRFSRKDAETNGPFLILEILPGSAAEKCGCFRINNRILQIDGHSVLNVDVKDAAALLKGAPLSSVAVTIQGDGDEKGQAIVEVSARAYLGSYALHHYTSIDCGR